MILRSFFRRISTKIYLILIFFVLIFICLFLNYIKYLDIVIDSSFSKKAFVCLEEANDDLYEMVGSDLNLSNERKIIKAKYIDGVIQKNYLNNIQLGDVALLTVDNKLLLEEDEIVVSVPSFYYKIIKDDIVSIEGSTLNIQVSGESLPLKIKSVVPGGEISYILVSEVLFDRLVERSDKFSIIANVMSNDVYVNEDYFSKYETSRLFSLETDFDLENRIKLEENIKHMEFAIVSACLVFFIIILIINKNIKYDLRKNRYLTQKLGFTNFQIKINIFKCFAVLHSIIFLLIIILLFVGLMIVNSVFDMPLGYNTMFIPFIVFIVLLLNDIFISISLK